MNRCVESFSCCHIELVSILDTAGGASVGPVSAFEGPISIGDQIGRDSKQPRPGAPIGQVEPVSRPERLNERFRSDVLSLTDADRANGIAEYGPIMPIKQQTELFGLGERHPDDVGITRSIIVDQVASQWRGYGRIAVRQLDQYETDSVLLFMNDDRL